MSKVPTFNVQRSRGTGTEPLTQEEKTAKAEFEAQISDCKTYADLCQKLAKMSVKEEHNEESHQGDKEDQTPTMMMLLQNIAQQQEEMKNMLVDHDKILNPKEKGACLRNEAQKQQRANVDETKEGASVGLGQWNEGQPGDRGQLHPSSSYEHQRRGTMSTAPAQYIVPEEDGEDICDQIERLAMEAYTEDHASYPRPSFGWGKGSMHTAVPPQIDINFSGSQFETWQRQWEAFLNGCCNNVHPTKVAAFIKAKLDEAMSKNLQNWIYSQQALRNAKPSVIIRAIKDRVFDRASVLTIVYRTLLKIQGEREPIEDIIVENNEVIRHFLAVYGRAEEALGVLMLLVRCRTLEIRQKLLQDQDRKYDDLCQLAKNYEAQHLHAANIYNIAATTIHQTHNVDETLYAGQPGRGRGQFRGRGGQRGGRGGYRAGQGGYRKRNGRSTSSSRSRSQTRGCGWCGDENRHPREDCPAADKTCKRCQKVGHYAHVCRASQNSSSRSQSRGRDSTKKTGPNSGQSNSVEEDASWIGMIELQEEESQNINTLVKEEKEASKTVISPKKRWIEQANAATTPKNVVKADNNVMPLSTVNATLADTAGHQVEVDGLPDTGANVNIMPMSIAKKFNVKKGHLKVLNAPTEPP